MPIQRLVVISDAHLGTTPPAVETALLRFLEGVPSLGDGLLLNGDLFGFWFAYRRAVPRSAMRVTCRLAELTRTLPVLMVGGNHDRWGDAAGFWSELGVRFEPHELRFALGNGTALAVHGDGLRPTPWTAALKQRLVTSPLASFGYRLLPAELGFWVADRIGGNLEPSTRRSRQEEATALHQRAWAERRLETDPSLGLLIMGHSHRPCVLEPFPGRRYLNPGAWYDEGRYAIASVDGVSLGRFPG